MYNYLCIKSINMRNIFALCFIIIITGANAQIVNIPDINFKNALISLGVDINNDQEIQETEAEKIITVNVSNKKISR